jgi:pyroglutamyl-peptidase
MPMLRRRKKPGPRDERREAAAAAPQPVAARSRRRMKPGTVVPPELRLPESRMQEAKRPVQKPAAPVTAEPPRPPQPKGKRHGDVILVTGFEPFAGEAINPSWEICERLPREIGGKRVETCLVPCAFRQAIEVAADAIERHRPALVLSLGQAGGRDRLSVERVAINVDDARIADNAGARPIDEPVAPDGPAAHFATLPVKAMVAAMRRAGVPAEVSNTAGTFVCNHLMYGVLHFIAARGFATRAGFIHVPYAEEQVLDKPGIAGMALDSMVRGVAASIEAAIGTRTDQGTESP